MATDTIAPPAAGDVPPGNNTGGNGASGTSAPGSGRARRRRDDHARASRRRRAQGDGTARPHARTSPARTGPARTGPVRRLGGLVATPWRRTARPRAAIARQLRVVTAFGWLVVGIAVASAWLARRLDWLEIWTLALAGALVLVLATGFVVGRTSYRVAVELGSMRVVVGARATGRVVVANDTGRPLRAARIELPVGRGLAAFRVPRLAARAEHEELFIVPTSRRGIITVGPVLSVRDDPLRVLRREVRWSRAQELYVHPATVVLDNSSSGFLRDIEGLPTRNLSESDMSFHALREYVAGDDRRSIHWRTTARTGRLMVRQYEETRRSHLVVALSVHPGDYAGGQLGDHAGAEEFELAVSAAASVALQAIREEKQVTVLTQHGALPSATGQRLLDALAGVELDAGTEDLVTLSRDVAAEVPGASVVAFAAGSGATPSLWQRVSVAVPSGALGFAVSCRNGQEVSRRTLGGFVVLGLGVLADLPRLLRRVAG